MRLGNNEYLACRIHCASRRSLRDDPGFDTLMEAIYPDAENYEEDRPKVGKDIAAPSAQRTSSRNYHNAYSRRKRNSQGTEPERSDPNGSENDDHDENKDSSPLKDEHGTQTKFRKRRREAPSPGPALKPETLTWGRGGVRSHGRHGSASGSRNARNTRLSKLVDYLESAQANDHELNIHLELLIPLDKQTTPSLKKPHLCCTPSTSVGHLREIRLVAQETKSLAKDVKFLAVKGNINHSILMDASNMLS
ncbi:putative E3 ubiquitin-protein ligase RING1a [Lycium barbarum]|uniref:putative E3 ubiquitin-protein ligase RING1a n=1 Tax=Lycium barbarum TaxID=112863 RepID=UPI00293F48CE|nr:putative E3 ubiquitin-protein ligase RING1a [Lycium barbarum]